MAARELRVVSWNLNGLDTDRLDSRMEAACLELLLGVPLADAMRGKPSPPMPDVIALQEVVRRSHLAQLRHHFGAAGFAIEPATPPREEGEYCLLAVRPPWRVESSRAVPFGQSPLGRHWLEADIAHGADRVRVLTAHMESLRSGEPARIAQGLELDARLHEDPELPSVFLGDTNLRASEWRALREQGLRALDAFEEAGAPAAHRDTWWPPESGRGSRFDRVWLGSSTAWSVARWRARRRDRVSDHAAVEALLRW